MRQPTKYHVLIFFDLTAFSWKIAGANRRWRGQFRCRGSRRTSAVAQFFWLENMWAESERGSALVNSLPVCITKL